MKNLLATTAVVALLGAPVWAQTTTSDPAQSLTVAEIPIGELIGDPVFISPDGQTEQVGTAIDVLLAANGVIAGVLVDTMGMPDLTPKVIAVDAQILVTATDAGTSKQILILDGVDKASLEATSEYDEQATTDAGFVRVSQLETPPATPAAPEQPVDTADAPTDATADPSAEPALALVSVDPAIVTPEELETAVVFDANEEQINDVSQVVVTDTGAVEDVVIKVGGFLGFGGKSVAVPVAETQIMRDPADNELKVFVNLSEDALKELPAFEG